MINLTPDFTFFYMLGIFVVVLFALNALVFQPTLKILEARHGQTDKLKDTVTSLNEETARLLIQYETHIAEVRAKGSKERERLVTEARDKQHKIVDAARAEAEKTLEGMRGDINHAMKEATLQMRQHVQELSRDIVARLLERKVA
ncbi:ATP synthase F0 subunit B [bacterium]|nr:ATP synthase F0 subunit B [bacterium]